MHREIKTVIIAKRYTVHLETSKFTEERLISMLTEEVLLNYFCIQCFINYEIVGKELLCLNLSEGWINLLRYAYLLGRQITSHGFVWAPYRALRQQAVLIT